MTDLHPFDGPRGLLGYTKLTCTYGTEIDVQQSSGVLSYSEDGTETEGPFVWLRLVEGSGEQANAHLSVAQARELRDALSQFLGGGDAELS